MIFTPAPTGARHEDRAVADLAQVADGSADDRGAVTEDGALPHPDGMFGRADHHSVLQDGRVVADAYCRAVRPHHQALGQDRAGADVYVTQHHRGAGYLGLGFVSEKLVEAHGDHRPRTISYHHLCSSARSVPFVWSSPVRLFPVASIHRTICSSSAFPGMTSLMGGCGHIPMATAGFWHGFSPRSHRAECPSGVELVYADAPALAEGDFGWWHEGFRGWERTRDWAVELLRTGPRIDGIFGFSQGAALTGLLAALRDSRPSPLWFEFAIMVGGFTSTMPQHAGLFRHKLTIPSVHVTGRADAIVPRRDSLLLADRFADPLIIEHPGGHVIPSDTTVTAPIAGFLAGFARDTGAAPALGESRSGR
jgi:hypothetical protein